MLEGFNDGLWVRGKQKIEFVPYDKITHIIFCEGVSEIRIGEQIVKKIHQPLIVLEKLFPENTFFRIHRNFIINKDFIESYDPAGKYISCTHGERIPVSRRRSKLLETFINN